MANPMENYVRALSKLETRISNIERNNQSQAFTSIRNLEIRDDDDNIIGKIGQLDDGSTGLETYAPEEVEPRVLPVPSAPLLEQGVGNIIATWDGQTLENYELQKDFYCIEIHISEDVEDFEASDLTLVSALYETEGSSAVIGPVFTGEWFVKLRVRARNGEVSEASAASSIEVELDLPELNDSLLNASGGTNYYSPTKPTGGTYGPNDIWFDTSVDPDTGLTSYMPHRWDEDLQDWVSVADERVNALKEAQELLEQRVDSIVVNPETGSKTYYQEAMPLPTDENPPKEGDTWWSTGEKNKPYRFTDGQWVSVRDQFSQPSTAVNVTSWGVLQPNKDAIASQWPSSSYQFELEAQESLGGQELAVVNIPEADNGNGYVTLPFQGVLNQSHTPSYGDDLLLNEGRPISIELDLLYSGAYAPTSAQRTLTAHYFKDGVLVESRQLDYSSIKSEVYPASTDFSNLLGYYANLLGYQYGMKITGTIKPSDFAADRIALTVAVPLPSGAGSPKKLAVWNIDTRIQVPESGIADGAIGRTKLAVDSIYAEDGVIHSIDAYTITVGKLLGSIIEGQTIIGDDAIIEGSLTAKSLGVGSITAESGVIGSLDLGKATVGELDGVRIKAGTINTSQLNSTAINGMEIVAAKIYTSKTGARIQLLTTGLSAYSASNVRTFNIASNTGDVEMIGKLYTGASGGYRTVLNQESWNDFSEFPIYGGGSVKSPMVGSGLRLGKDTSVTTSAEVFYAEETYYTGDVNKYLRLNGPTVSSRRSEFSIGTSGLLGGYRNTSNALFLSSISADKDGATLRHETGSNSYFSIVDVYQSSASNPKVMIGAKASTKVGDMNTIFVGGDGVSIEGGKAVMTFTETSNGPRVQSTSIWDVNSSSGDPVRVNASGTLFKSSSSRRYKTDIQHAEDLYSVLAVEPKTWLDNEDLATFEREREFREEVPIGPAPQEYSAVATEPTRVYGAVAEEVDDLGLTQLVSYDAFNRPDGLHYDKFGVALIPVVRDLSNRIAELENLLAKS